jgi:hypothetical protein
MGDDLKKDYASNGYGAGATDRSSETQRQPVPWRGPFQSRPRGVGLVSTIAAALGLSMFGFIAQKAGNRAGFMSMAAVAAARTLRGGR